MGFNKSAFTKESNDFINNYGWAFPNPFFYSYATSDFLSDTCGNDIFEKLCDSDYYYGRTFVIGSTDYYKKLFNYVNNPKLQEQGKMFLELNKDRIKIFIPSTDQILEYSFLIQEAKKLKIPLVIVPNSSHEGIIFHQDVWMPVIDKDSSDTLPP